MKKPAPNNGGRKWSRLIWHGFLERVSWVLDIMSVVKCCQ